MIVVFRRQSLTAREGGRAGGTKPLETGPGAEEFLGGFIIC